MARLISVFITLASLLLSPGTGCSSAPKTHVGQEGPANALIQAKLPHPVGPETADVRALFFEKGAPPIASLEQCDFDYHVESQLGKNREELFYTFPEIVRADPERFHWCFYSRLLYLLEDLDKDLFLDQKQKLIADRFLFLTHLARIFQVDFEDAHYLRVAIQVYRKLAVRHMSRTLSVNVDTQRSLITAEFPEGLPSDKSAETQSVFGKKDAPASESPVDPEPR